MAGSAASHAAGSASAGGLYRLQAMTLKAGARDAQGGSRSWLAAQGLAGTLALDAAGQLLSLQAEPGRVQLLTTALNWRELRWRADGGAGRLDVAAELETIAVAPLLARLQPELGWGGALTIGGRIDIHSAARFDADVVLERIAGDLSVTDEQGDIQPLGLSDLRLALSAHDGLWQIAQGLAGRRIGTVVGAQVLRSTPERRWPAADAPLQGVLEARVANLGAWGTWLPPGWRLSGRLDTEAQFSGTLGGPQIKGSVRGTDLGLRNLLQGVSLTEGQLNLVLAGDTARIEQLSFKGGDGRLDVTGSAVLGASPTATLRVVANQFRALGRIDRRVVVSGDTVLKLDRERLRLDGSLVIDEGLIDISRTDAPSLDDDVVVSRSAAAAADPASGRTGGVGSAGSPPRTTAAAAPAPLRNTQVNLKLGLGQNLRLRGQGVDTLVRGDLALTSPGGRLALNGTVRTHQGLYAAYGQKLEITRGDFIFSGPLDNPRLDVLALRPNLDVLVGVSIAGSASNPRIRLYSEPDMAEYDKLSWLVLGRASEGLGTTDAALLQRAAFALLSGNSAGPTDQMLSALGLTEFSVKQTEGDTRDTVISLGKQLSRRWWVGYERGVHATTGTWQVIYRVAQRFTLRAQSGEQNALDVIWTWRW
jgi:translocation and assembly module TamB